MTMIYIGPSIKGIIQTGAAFSGGYPPVVSALLLQRPFLKELMVEPGQLAEARKEIRDPKSRLGMFYQKAEKEGGFRECINMGLK